MKKQFIRVKQLADQKFSRSGKSEALTDELQAADRKVEQLRTALQGVCKRLGPPGGGIAQSQDPAAREKRLRKLHEYTLGLAMHEASNFDDDSILKYIMQECAKTEIALANEIAEHEIKVEQLVLAPLNTITEQDLPSILKAKKQLSRLMSEKDSAANRYQYLIRTGDTGGSYVSGGGSAASAQGTKLCLARDELDEAGAKAELARDALAADMFALLARETELANTLLQYVKLQRAYHESALHALSEIVPDLEKFINDSSVKPMFGYPLEEHLRVSGRTIAYPIELCVCALHELGLGEEGLFRIAGSITRVRRMKLSLDAGIFTVPLTTEYRDVHVIAAVLKSYLRELPEPLVPRSLHADILMTAARGGGPPLKEVLDRLPPTRHANLRYLVKFLSALTKNQAVNKMTSFNLAVVIAPNLLWFDMNTTAAVNHAVELLIRDADYYFGRDISFFSTFAKEDLLPDMCDYGFSPANNHAAAEQPNGESDVSAKYNMSKSSLEFSGAKNLTQGRHSRSNSHDASLILVDNNIKRAQSNSSLSDQSSPPQGSPKPIVRRKNKPVAPVPPNFNTPDRAAPPVAEAKANTENGAPKVDIEIKPDKPPRPVGPDVTKIISGVQTIDRSTYKNGKAKAAENVDSRNETRRKSVDFEREAVEIEANAGTQSVTTQTKNSVSAKCGFLPTKQTVTVQNRPIPVAAPRSTVAPNKQPDSISLIEAETNAEVQLRQKPPEIAAKPAVPERPATLRPQSFRSSVHKISAVDAPDAPTALERTHVYTVEKQSPTIVQISKTDAEDGTKNSVQRTHSTGSPKAEKSNRPIEEHRPLTRTLSQSEGNILEVPPSPRNPHRPPRPQIPAPPPPTLPAFPVLPLGPESLPIPTPAPRPKSDGAESTDL